ncbi:MAG: hypothetical protein LBS37_11085 [Treponema sp.]|jgi:hypothetical protein|nr:hypothetical protein [Treponema sp.]
MTIEQTVEIPADHRLVIEVPPEIPTGRAKAALTLVFETETTKAASEKWVNPLLGLAKDSSLTVERFMEMQRKDIELENEIDKRRWGNEW